MMNKSKVGLFGHIKHGVPKTGRPVRVLLAVMFLLSCPAKLRAQAVAPPTLGQVVSSSTNVDTGAQVETAFDSTSLMFTNRDLIAIEEAIARSPLFDTKAVAVAKQDIEAEEFDGDITAYSGGVDLSLGGIMYFTEDNWTIWVNGKAYGPQDSSPFFRIETVHPRYADLSVPRVSGIMKPVRLAPNQTFLFRLDKVIEGRQR